MFSVFSLIIIGLIDNFIFIHYKMEALKSIDGLEQPNEMEKTEEGKIVNTRFELDTLIME